MNPLQGNNDKPGIIEHRVVKKRILPLH